MVLVRLEERGRDVTVFSLQYYDTYGLLFFVESSCGDPVDSYWAVIDRWLYRARPKLAIIVFRWPAPAVPAFLALFRALANYPDTRIIVFDRHNTLELPTFRVTRHILIPDNDIFELEKAKHRGEASITVRFP